MSQRVSIKRGSFILAGILFLFFSGFDFGWRISAFVSQLDWLDSTPFSWYFSTFLGFVSVSLFLLIGIMFFFRKNNIILPILFGMVALIELYWAIDATVSLVRIHAFEYSLFPSLASLLVDWLFFLASLFMMILGAAGCRRKISGLRHAWFLPMLFSALGLICLIICGYRNWFDIFKFIVFVAAFAFGGFALSRFISNVPSKEEAVVIGKKYGYCAMAKHVLLMLFFGWIWLYVWIYRVTKYLNITPGTTYRKPGAKTALCMFIPFYYIYWVFQSAKRIDILAKKTGIGSNIKVPALIFSFFIGIVPPIIMQNKINQICIAKKDQLDDDDDNDDAEEAVPAQPAHVDTSAEIRNFKQLLDDGIITEAEFEEKKRQLLGM